jgi:uncharacterized protein (DUF305 family)
VMLGQALVINGAMLDRQLGAVLKSFAAANKKAEQDMVRKISMFPYPKVMTECASVSTRTLQRFILESAKAGTGAPNANLDHAGHDMPNQPPGMFQITQTFNFDKNFVYHMVVDRKMASSLASTLLKKGLKTDETFVEAANEFERTDGRWARID